MPVFEKRSQIAAPVKALFNWHNRSRTFERLSPSWQKVRVLEKKGGLEDGARMVMELQQGPFRRKWVAIHSAYIEGKQFCDEQVQGPFAKWVHTHKFLPESDTTSLIDDHIEYATPLGFLGNLVAGGYIRGLLERLFTFRHTRTQNDLMRYQAFARNGSLKIVLTGASGMVGSQLRAFLSCAGHEVISLVRHAPHPGSSEIFWDPIRGELDKTSLESVDAVIHLAGENIGAGRWTAARKAQILDSRVAGTAFLAETLAKLKHPPKVFIVSSAIGFYGDRGEEILTEESPAGKGFLSDVCQAWEKAAEPAKKAGIRVVNVRTGIVLSAAGGALPKMVTPILLGVGGTIGSGKQWMSWVSMEDLVGLYHYLIHAGDISGPVNATAPGSVTNKSFIKTLGKVLGWPTLFPLPGFMVKLLLGEMGEALLLEGQQVKPAKLEKAGFKFLYPDLESALRWELGK
jgi:hypothetical protein